MNDYRYSQAMMTWPRYLKWRKSPSVLRSRVRGGRWSVRRMPDEVPMPYFIPIRPGSSVGPWRAWSDSKASKWNKWFNTYEEAMHYATTVSMLYRRLEDHQINRLVIDMALKYGFDKIKGVL